MARAASAPRVHIPIGLQEDRNLVVRIWDRFGEEVAEFEKTPDERHSVEWDLKSPNGYPVPAGQYIVRITCGDKSESSILQLKK